MYQVGMELKLDNELKHSVQCLAHLHSINICFYYIEIFLF